jgi:hypothetical protein
MRELIDLHVERLRMESFYLGVAVNAAMSDDPKKALSAILEPPQPLDPSSLHPMIRGSLGKVASHE